MGLDDTRDGPDHQTQGWKEAYQCRRSPVVKEEEVLSEVIVGSSIGSVEPLKPDYQPSIPQDVDSAPMLTYLQSGELPSDDKLS